MKNKYLILLLFIITWPPKPVSAETELAQSIFTDSNQWKFDKPQGFVGISLTNSNIVKSLLDLNNFQIHFDDKNTNYPSIETELIFYNTKTLSFFSDYSIGFLRKEGLISSLVNGTSYAYQTSELLALPLSLGLGLIVDWNFFLQPLFKVNLQTIPYRVSSSLTSAETEGHSEASELSLGLRCKTLFSSLTIEAMYNNRKNFGESKIFKNNNFSSLGLGWVF